MEICSQDKCISGTESQILHDGGLLIDIIPESEVLQLSPS